MTKIVQLYPKHQSFDSVHGLYLDEPLKAESGIVYGAYLLSLDGRISVQDGGRLQLPELLTSSNDFRLFMELQAHSDCVVTHAGYLRDRANGMLGDMLHFDAVKQADLLRWRAQHGLSEERMVVICSASLDFPEPLDLKKHRVLIVAGSHSDPGRIQAWRDKGYRVEIAGTRWVEADRLMALLQQNGCRSVFVAGGPKLLTSMIKHRCLDRLYLTIAHQFIGGAQFSTMIEDEVNTPCQVRQVRLLYDTGAACPQWYACFEFLE